MLRCCIFYTVYFILYILGHLFLHYFTLVSADYVHQTPSFLYRKKSFLFSALYAACILGGRHVMKQREKFNLRKPLVLWSLTLAVFR